MLYGWIAAYRDGTTISHINDGKEVSADAIDRERVQTFMLFNILTKKAILTLHLDQEQKFIYRRRTEISPNRQPIVCHLVGWRKTINNECVQSIAYCFEDDRIELAGKFREDHPWFYSPKLRATEL